MALLPCWIFSGAPAEFHFSLIHSAWQCHCSLRHHRFLHGDQTHPYFYFSCFHGWMKNSSHQYDTLCLYTVFSPYSVCVALMQGPEQFHCNRQETIIRLRLYWPEWHPSIFSWENHCLERDGGEMFPPYSRLLASIDIFYTIKCGVEFHIFLLPRGSLSLCPEHGSRLHNQILGGGLQKTWH